MKNTKIINGLSLTRKMSLHETPSKFNNFNRNRGIKVFPLSAIIVFAVLFGFSIISCDDGNKSCSHKWEWKVTTKAEVNVTGLETETCNKCGVKSGKTKTIEQLIEIGSEDGEPLADGGNGDNEQLTGSGKGEDGPLADGGNGNDEQLSDSGKGDDEQLTGSGKGEDGSLADGGNGNDEQLSGGGKGDDEEIKNGGDVVQPVVINIPAIKGVTHPVPGWKPVYTIEETEQYTGTVSWSDNPDVFKSLTIYVATITLTAKEGFTLQGVKADFFTVEGIITSVTNAADSGVISAAFPRTKGIMSVIHLDVNTSFTAKDDPDFLIGTSVTVIKVDSTKTWMMARQYIISGPENHNYIINIIGDLTVSGAYEYDGNTFGSVAGIKVSLRGTGSLALLADGNPKGALIYLYASQKVFLHNLTLKGCDDNNSALVIIPNNAAFTMHSGKITKNYNSSPSSEEFGGGVRNEGTFVMNGGEISDNSCYRFKRSGAGGGVFINSGTFIMNGGIITRNNAIGISGSGGGIYIKSGSIKIKSGLIYGNNADDNSNHANYGSALYLEEGSAEFGVFNNVSGEWMFKGNLLTNDKTIRIQNGISFINKL